MLMKIKEDNPDSFLAFMVEANKLKDVDRSGWVISGVKNCEHDGDHSYSTAVQAYLFAKEMGLNAEKCMIMALLHDISKTVIGDIATRFDKKNAKVVCPENKKENEKKVEKELALILHGESRKDVDSTLDELREEKTDEARLVKQLDRLDYIIQLVSYSDKIKSDAEVERFFLTARARIDIPEIVYLFEKVKRQVYGKRGMRY
jgi:5'-deoxynucleotidase YfbR-like HD superfamily hydrolase